MNPTTNSTPDFTLTYTDVEQHILVSKAIVKATMQAMPDTQDTDDVGLLIAALMDQLDLAHQALEKLWDAHTKEEHHERTADV